MTQALTDEQKNKKKWPNFSRQKTPGAKRKKKWLWIGAVIIILIIVGTRLGRKKQVDNENTSSETLIPVARQDLNETIEVSGTISAANYTQVQTQAIGTVTKIYVQEGNQVKEGDKLFELELTPEGKQNNQSAYASYLQAQNSLKSAQNQLNSLQVTLFDKNKYFIDHAVEEDLDHSDPDWIMQNADWLAAENSYINQEQVIKQAQANVTSAYQTYRNTGAIVYAPVSGTVENITAVEGLSFGSVASGSGVSLSARLATIKTGEQVLAIFNVSASDILKIQLGQKVTLTSSNLPRDYTGSVVSVDRYGTTGNTTTYQVIARFNEEKLTATSGDRRQPLTQLNDDKNHEASRDAQTQQPVSGTQDLTALLPNLTVDGEILISENTGVLVVPTLAITTQAGQAYVEIRTDDGQNERRAIETGVSNGNLTQVVSGVQEGEQVVFSLPEYSTSGMMGGGMMGGGMMGGGPGVSNRADRRNTGSGPR